MSAYEKEISGLAADDISELQFESVGRETKEIVHRVSRAFDMTYIFAALLDRALGEFITKSLYAAAAKCQFDNVILVSYYRTDRPYKKPIMALNPFTDKSIANNGSSMVPIDFFYGFGDRAPVEGMDRFVDAGFSHPDLILTPSMMTPMDLLRFDYLPYLAVPAGQQDDMDQRLVDLGLDPNRWFCCVYHREPTYKFRPPVQRRDVEPDAFRKLVEWVIKELGGQVVRIGHPEMTEFPTMPGFVDLSRISDDIILQANAVARARFAVMTSSGPASLPGALGTPCAMVNATSICLVWRDTDFALPRHFVGPEGEVYNVEQAIAEGSWNDSSIENMIRQAGFQPVDNTPAELQAVAQKLFDQTTDTPGWRARIDPLAHAATYVDRPERHVVGAPIRRSVRIVEYPDLAPVALPR